MSAFLGFNPSKETDAYFLSYNNEESERISGLVCELYKQGVPLWYDYGLKYGEEWEHQIAERVKTCKAVLIFITADTFRKADTYIRKEYNLATKVYKKTVYVVFMDQIEKRMVPLKMLYWWVEMSHLQCILAPTAQKIMEAIDFSVAQAVNMDDLSLISSDELLILGERYHYGHNGKEINLGLAFKLLKIAADRGNDKAQHELGVMYCEGEGTEQNYEKGMYYLQLSAAQNNSGALNSIGYLYSEGLGVTQDYSQAFTYYKLAADMGNVDALFNLSSLYVFGNGIEKDEEMGFQYCKKAADNGHSWAQYVAGLSYLSGGVGVESDEVQAVKYFNLASEQKVPEAQCELALCYYGGKGLTEDKEQAAKWMFMSANQGNAKAQYFMGIFYEYGEGVTPSLVEAKKYYKLAAEQGYEKAAERLKKLEV